MNFKKIILLIIISFFLFSNVNSVFAREEESAGFNVINNGLVGCGKGDECTAEDLLGSSSGDKLFSEDGIFVQIFNFVMGILGSVVFLYFIYGGILLMTSRGDKGKINKAKTIMTGSITGLAIIFFAYAFVQLLLTLFLGDFASNYLQN